MHLSSARRLAAVAILVLLTGLFVHGADPGAASAAGRPSLVLTNLQARLVVDLRGGALGEFRRLNHPINPLQWGTPSAGDHSIHGFGHFLCLDRWGPPSDAEGARGMPYHGEASNVPWTVEDAVQAREGVVQARMSARLPKAGLAVRRTLRLSATDAVFSVVEEITNENALGRLYNVVQHPTIAPPFLDSRTVVECNGRRGFAQGGSLPNPEEPSSYWPRVFNADGESVDVRRLEGDPNPNVVTFAIDDSHGWVTAFSPTQGLLLGYFWSTQDYPWVSLWRDVRDGKPAARGLEFGSTGLHQPYPVLVQKGRVWDRQLYEYLDAGQSVQKTYLGFLVEVPADFGGVERVTRDADQLVIRERTSGKPRDFRLSVAHLHAP